MGPECIVTLGGPEMADVNSPAENAETYRWRPAVAPYRSRRPPRIRKSKPLPGQMVFPGMEPDVGSPEPAKDIGQNIFLKSSEAID